MIAEGPDPIRPILPTLSRGRSAQVSVSERGWVHLASYRTYTEVIQQREDDLVVLFGGLGRRMLLVTPKVLKRGGLLEFDTLDVNDPQTCRRIGDIGPTMLIIPSFD